MKKTIVNRKVSFRSPIGKFNSQSGFTLIEIMVVVIIIGLLSAFIVPNLLDSRDRASIVKAEADISAIASQMTMYKLDNFAFPNTSEGIQALVTNPGKSTWRGYLNKLPKDPWNNDYQYSQPGTNNTTTYDIWSLGSDGAPGGEGSAADIGNWDN